MTDDPTSDQLRDLLASAAPDGPDLPPAARTAAVRDRARVVRRRQGLAVAAAVLVALGALAVPVLVSGDDAPSQVAEDPAPDGPDTPAPCPAEPVVVPAADGAESLPDGALSARLCPAILDGEDPNATMGGPNGGPVDPSALVEDGVDAFVAAVRALPAYESAPECAMTMMAIEPWSVVVSYSDGTSVVLGTTTRSCSSVPVEGVQRSSEGILDAFADASARQPSDPSETADPSAADLTCPDLSAAWSAAPEPATLAAEVDAVRGLVCYLADPMGSREYAEDSGVLTGAQAATLGREVRATVTPRPQQAGRCTDTGPTRVVLLQDADGGLLTLVDASCTSEFRSSRGYWLASDESEAILSEALGGTVDD